MYVGTVKRQNNVVFTLFLFSSILEEVLSTDRILVWTNYTAVE